MGVKKSLKDKLEDDTLDLSLSQLSDVPVEEIAEIPRATKLDLSNNQLTQLPDNFSILTHLVRLDLSKNKLVELPEYFGELRSLRYLDLYSNQLQTLPVSFGQLRNLKWLDLKNNNLKPALQQAAGNCITKADCALCAKKVVALMQSMQSQLEQERQRRAMEEQRVLMEQRQAEEAERERIRAEKRAAKERRRKEDAAKVSRQASNGKKGMNDKHFDHEMEQPKHQLGNGNADVSKPGKAGSGGCCWSIFMFLLGMAFVGLATGISLLWIYTGGNLDQKSIDMALPQIKRDVGITLGVVGKRAEGIVKATQENFGPLCEELLRKGKETWDETVRISLVASNWVYVNSGPSLQAGWTVCQDYLIVAQKWVQSGWSWFKSEAWVLMQKSAPVIRRLGEQVIDLSLAFYKWAETNLPPFIELVIAKTSQWLSHALTFVQTLVS